MKKRSVFCICKEILVHTLNCSLKEYKFASIPFIFMCTNQTILNSSSTFYLKTSNLIWLLLPSPQIKFSSDTTSISEKRRLSCLHTKLLMEHSRTTKWEKGRIVSYLKCWERGIQWKNDFLCDKLFMCSPDIHFNIQVQNYQHYFDAKLRISRKMEISDSIVWLVT